MKSKLLSLISLAAAGVILFATASRAIPLSPGTSGTPDNLSLSGLSFVASGSGSGTFASGPTGPATANFTEAVYSTSLGTLDFMFQVANTSTNASGQTLATETNTNYGGFSTDVGYLASGSGLPSNPFVAGTGSPPNGVDRSALPGSTVDFNFNLFSSGLITAIGPGVTTDILVIITNATNYDSNGTLGLAFLTPDAPATGIFEPAAVPLPGALPLFATGLGALGLLGWRRKKKAAA